MSELVDHAHVKIVSPEPTGEGGAALNQNLVALADYDLALAAAVAAKADADHDHLSADISDATHLPTPNTVLKRDASGNATLNRLDVESIYWGSETIVIDGQTIYCPTVAVTASHFIGSGQFLTSLPSHTHTIPDTADLQAALDGKQAAGSYASAVHTHAVSDITSLQTFLDAKAPLANPTFTGTLRSQYISSTNSTAKLQDGYAGGMDMVFVDGGIFRMTEMDQTGTNDVFFQLYPVASSGYSILEAWGSAGLILGTGNNDNPITLRTNRVNRFRVASSGLNSWSDTSAAGAAFYLRTSTHDTANSTYSIIWRNDLNNADVGIIKLTNPSANSFTMSLGTYQYPTTISMSGGHTTVAGDIIGSSFWNLKAGANGDGRLDIRAGQVNVFASLNPQSSMYMGFSGGNVSFDFGWTGKTGGNYRSIYAHYDNTDLIFLSQWADGSWNHEMGRWNDHGDLKVVGALGVGQAPTAKVDILETNSGRTILKIKQASGQSANSIQVVDSDNAELFQVSASGAAILASTVRATAYVVGDYQVVGERQAAIDDASEDLASVTAKLNAALAALRAHGLIATTA